MEQTREFLHRATVRENLEGYHPSYGLFDSDIEACHWLTDNGWQQILVNGPHRTFTKSIDGRERKVEVVKLDFEPIHLLSLQ